MKEEVDVLSKLFNTKSWFQHIFVGKGQFSHSFDNGNFLMRWTFDDQNNKLTFHVKVKTTGWVGFGFARVAPTQMRNYDVVVGGYDNVGYLMVSLREICYETWLAGSLLLKLILVSAAWKKLTAILMRGNEFLWQIAVAKKFESLLPPINTSGTLSGYNFSHMNTTHWIN